MGTKRPGRCVSTNQALAKGAIPVITRNTAITLSQAIDLRLTQYFTLRCVELAHAAHLDGTPKLISMRERTCVLVVPSKDRSMSYQVVADYAGTTWCDCIA